MVSSLGSLRGQFLEQEGFHLHHSGKIRDMYVRDDLVLMHTTDKISAFDVVFSQEVPFKGAILNALNAHFQREASRLMDSWMRVNLGGSWMLGRWCFPLQAEFIVRGYLCGSAWRRYADGERVFGGEVLPEGLKEGDVLPKRLFTPTTKGVKDEDISEEALVSRGLLTDLQLMEAKKKVFSLFHQGSLLAAQRGLLLGDAKYELGVYREGGKEVLCVIDELHTPDSARYFYAGRKKGAMPLSKEALRAWLMAEGMAGRAVALKAAWVKELSLLYRRIYRLLLGRSFVSVSEGEEGWCARVKQVLKNL